MGAGKSKQQTDPKQLGLTTNYYQGYPNMPDYRGSPQNFQMQLAQPGAFPQTPIDQIYQPPNILDNNVQQDGFNYQHFIPEPHLQQQQPQIANNFHNSHPKFHSEHTPTNYNHLAASSTHYPNTFSPRGMSHEYSGFVFKFEGNLYYF